MSPFVMVDHFHMWEPTFDVHPHAGFSAVTLVFEDTKGVMVSRDSIGNNSTFGAGDLHWTMAGRGVLHTQLPVGPQAHIHALQIFVNLPASMKRLPASSFHVRGDTMPVVETEQTRVRVAAGAFQERTSSIRAPRPILMLDIYFKTAGACLEVPLPAEWNAWVHTVQGNVAVDGGSELLADEAICVSADAAGGFVRLQGSAGAHCVLLAAARIDEPVVSRGPFVFESEASLNEAVREFRAGKFGSVVAE